jgi:DNA-binding MarR family transcriptional regulator
MKYNGESPKGKSLDGDTSNPVLQEGFTKIPNFILKDQEISRGAKMTYAMFLHYAGQNDFCFPGQTQLAQDIGCARATVTQFATELVKAGLLTIQRRGKGKTNVYKVYCPKSH